MKLPPLTCIIPTYKRPHFLKRAVQSVLGQTHKDFILLIADNASGKETEEVVEHFMRQDARIHYLKHPENIGAIENFHAGLMHAKTPYVCFLSDDDFYAPFFFEEVLAPFEMYPDIAFSGGGGLIINQNYETIGIDKNQQTIPPCGYYPPPSGFFTYLRSSFGIAFPALIYKTELLKELGGFDLRIRNGGDEYLVSQCAARYPVFLQTNRPFYFGFQHPGSLSIQIDYPLFEREAEFLYERLQEIPFTPDEKSEIDQFFYKRILKIRSNAYRYYYAQKEFEKARGYAEKNYQQSHSSSWKRKMQLASLCKFVPFLSTLYDSIQQTEKALRNGFKKTNKETTAPPCAPPDLSWKDYTLSLEK